MTIDDTEATAVATAFLGAYGDGSHHVWYCGRLARIKMNRNDDHQ